MIKIQLYQNAEDRIGSEFTEQDAIDVIAGRHASSSNIERRIITLRKLHEANQADKILLQTTKQNEKAFATQLQENIKKYEAQKIQLPAVTWAALFVKRDMNQVKQLSGLMVADIDKEVIIRWEPYINDQGKKTRKAIKAPQIHSYEELVEAKKKLEKDPYVRIVFISPSGNGLKVVFNISGDITELKENFASIAYYVEKNYKYKIDQSGKDVSRLCFLSYDKTIYYNPNSKVLPIVLPPPNEPNTIHRIII